MRNDLDYSRLDAARALIAEGDVIVEHECRACNSDTATTPMSPCQCEECRGRHPVLTPTWKFWMTNRQLDYWQARAMVAEMGIISLVTE